MSRLLYRSQSEKKSGGCDKFGSVSTDVKSVHTGRESEGHLSWYAAYCVHHFIVHVIIPQYTVCCPTYEERWVHVMSRRTNFDACRITRWDAVSSPVNPVGVNVVNANPVHDSEPSHKGHTQPLHRGHSDGVRLLNLLCKQVVLVLARMRRLVSDFKFVHRAQQIIRGTTVRNPDRKEKPLSWREENRLHRFLCVYLHPHLYLYLHIHRVFAFN